MPRIDWGNVVFPALCLTFMFVAAYGGAWANALMWLYLAWADQYLTGEKEKALPRESYLIDPLPRLVRYRR